MALYKLPKDMTFQEWKEYRAEQEAKLTHGAEKITDNDIYRVFFIIDQECFGAMFQYMPLYWKPEDAPKALGMYKDNHIMIDRDFHEEHGIDDAFINLVYHEMLHGYCDWKNIEDVKKDGYHLKTFAEAAELCGGHGRYDSEEDGYSDVRLKKEYMERVKARLSRKAVSNGTFINSL